MVVDVGRTGRLDDENVIVTDRRVDLNAGLEGEELGDPAGSESNAETGLEKDMEWKARLQRRMRVVGSPKHAEVSFLIAQDKRV